MMPCFGQPRPVSIGPAARDRGIVAILRPMASGNVPVSTDFPPFVPGLRPICVTLNQQFHFVRNRAETFGLSPVQPTSGERRSVLGYLHVPRGVLPKLGTSTLRVEFLPSPAAFRSPVVGVRKGAAMEGDIRTQTTRGGLGLSSGPVVIDLHGHGPAWHDEMYRAAHGDPGKVPWATCGANPALVSWLNAEAAGRVRPGSRAAVVGCGLGDDVIELVNRGYDAIGFDLSPTAVDWARSRFPAQASAFCVCDLLAPPTRFRHRFELVVECCTLQSLEPATREQATAALVSLLCPRGTLIAVAHGRGETELLEQVHGPPWPLTRMELTELMESVGLKPARPVDDFVDDGGHRRVRGVFERA